MCLAGWTYLDTPQTGIGAFLLVATPPIAIARKASALGWLLALANPQLHRVPLLGQFSLNIELKPLALFQLQERPDADAKA